MAKNEWLSNYLIENHPESYSARNWAFTGAQPNRGRAIASMFIPTAHPGTPRYLSNLENAYSDVARKHGGIVPPKIEERFTSARGAHINAAKYSRGMNMFARNAMRGGIGIAGLGLSAAFTFATTQGSFGDKSAATGIDVAGSTVGIGGALAGAKLGGLIGTAFGPVGTVVGGAIGGVVGGIGSYMGVSAIGNTAYDFANRMVENQKRKRGLEWNEWAGQTQAFNTQRAVTMRQRSLEAMNRGMMNSRSLMGREAGFMHR